MAIKRNSDAQVEFCCKQVPSKAPALTPPPLTPSYRPGPGWDTSLLSFFHTNGGQREGQVQERTLATMCCCARKKLAVKVNVATSSLHMRFLHCVGFWKYLPCFLNVYGNHNNYSACHLIGSRIIESAAYCKQILLVPLFLNSTQNTSVN